MTHRGPFQPLLFCDSVILCWTFLERYSYAGNAPWWVTGSKPRALTGLCRCPARAAGGGTHRKWQHLWGWRERRIGRHNKTMGSTQQQSGEEMISYRKCWGTEPGHGKLLKRHREVRGLAVAEVSKWQAEEEGLHIKEGEAAGDQAHQLRCVLF